MPNRIVFLFGPRIIAFLAALLGACAAPGAATRGESLQETPRAQAEIDSGTAAEPAAEPVEVEAMDFEARHRVRKGEPYFQWWLPFPRGLWSVGGDMDEVTETVGFWTNFSFDVLFVVPVGAGMAVAPVALFSGYFLPIKHTEMGWQVGLWGLGLRFSPWYEPWGNFFVQGDASYLTARGREDDFIRHPGFDTTLFRRDGPPGHFEPRNLYGYTLGVSTGVDLFGAKPFGIGVDVGLRYQDGTRGITAWWITGGLAFSLRF